MMDTKASPAGWDEPGFAPIEELDPEPPARAARAHRREVLIGLLLVGALAAFGLIQWWDQSGKLAHYQAGERAAAAHDWAAAEPAYRAAAGYADAGDRANTAAQMIATHTEQSRLATTAARAANWPQALQAAQNALQIVPGDPQMAPLAQQAATHVYALALSGTVAVRVAAEPPGLYVYGAGGWHWLARSDTQSRVRGSCADGAILYDVRDSATPPALAAQPGTGRRGGAGLLGRQLLMAGPDGSLRSTLAFDPAQYARYVCTDSGIWAYKLPASYGGGPPLSQAAALSLVYQAFDSRRLVTPALSGWSVVAFAADGRHILLADSASTSNNWTYRLGIAAPDGSAIQTIRTGSGNLESVDWSPDGRSLLLTVNEQVGAGVRKTVFLTGIDAAQPEVPLVSANLALDQSANWFNLPPIFLRSGPRAGQVLLAGRPDARLDHGPVALIDPAPPGAAVVTLNVPAAAHGPRFIRQDYATGDLLVAWLDDTAGGAPAATIAVVNASARVQFLNAPVVRGATLADAWLRDGRLIYATTSAEGTSGQRAYIMRSLPLAGPNQAVAPTEIYTTTMARRAGGDSTLRLGPGLLAYVAPGNELRARSYDGTVDVLLEKDVAGLYDLNADSTPTAMQAARGVPYRFAPPAGTNP